MGAQPLGHCTQREREGMVSVVSKIDADECQESLAFELATLDGVGDGLCVDLRPVPLALEKLHNLEVARVARHVPARVPQFRSEFYERAENGNVLT